MQEPVTQHQSDIDMRILKIGTCPSLSGLSEISFMVSCQKDAKDVSGICFRINGNSGGGKYNPDLITIAAIEKALAGIPPEQTFTAAAFSPLYIGGSTCSPGFLGSILLHVGLIARAPDSRAYVRHSAQEFWAEMEKALAAGVSLVPPSIGHTAGNTGGDTAKVKPGKKSKATQPVAATSHG